MQVMSPINAKSSLSKEWKDGWISRRRRNDEGRGAFNEGHRFSLQRASDIVFLDRQFCICLLFHQSVCFTQRDLFCELQMLQGRRWRNSAFLHRQTEACGGHSGFEGLIQAMVFAGRIHVLRWHFRRLGKGMHEFLAWC